MHKQVISFAQVITFLENGSQGGFLTPTQPNTPLAYALVLDIVFMHNTPLRDILSIFLEASKVILDAVFLYFRLLAFAIDIFALQYMSGKNNGSSKSRLACFTAKRNGAVPHQTL